jgi:diketogulonate reductase-like aldo/keto reductase
MKELYALSDGHRCAANQVLYNLAERGIEWHLLDWCREHRVAVMAYSPIAQGALLADPKLKAIAHAARVTPAQLALAWVMNRPQVIAIPQSSNAAHIDDIRESAGVKLGADILAALDSEFPAPRRATPLAVI